MTHGNIFCRASKSKQFGTMKAGKIYIILFLGLLCNQLPAQMNCVTSSYTREKVTNNPSIINNSNAIEQFTRRVIEESRLAGRIENNVFKIPVVVHNLYHTSSEKVTDAQVAAQLKTLNDCFRRKNADTVNTPEVFKSLAADCEFEFQLAISDSHMKATTGIIRKYTPVTSWLADDKMKYSEEMGDDAWDTKNYLNIWVCNMDKYAGYSSVMGGPENADGIVLSLAAFGAGEKTIVHETGHWLGLKHLWGDEYCGDDGVSDTPKQASYTIGCPTTVRITCGNSPTGDMYNNYMDFTNDACMNLFTEGQKTRMRALFTVGGVRSSLLTSTGLDKPLIFESPLPEDEPKWLEAKLYPNPASTMMILDLSYDIRWIGKTIFVTNLAGQSIMNVLIRSKNQSINVSNLKPGIYFLAAKNGQGVSIKMKFVKL